MLETGARCRPIFTFAAWFSVIAPLLAVGWAIYASNLPPEQLGDKKPHLNKADSVGLAFVFALSFVAGCASLGGVKTNGAFPCITSDKPLMFINPK